MFWGIGGREKRKATEGPSPLLWVVGDVLHHILHPAIQYPAKHFDGVGADIFVSLDAGDLAGADVVGVDQAVLCDLLLAHGFP